jgi:hypothetical protein
MNDPTMPGIRHAARAEPMPIRRILAAGPMQRGKGTRAHRLVLVAWYGAGTIEKFSVHTQHDGRSGPLAAGTYFTIHPQKAGFERKESAAAAYQQALESFSRQLLKQAVERTYSWRNTWPDDEWGPDANLHEETAPPPRDPPQRDCECPPASYSWAVTRIHDDGWRGASVIGPHNAPLSLGEILEHPDRKLFRLLDDDRNPCAEGVYVGPDDETLFGPLDDYGRGMFGCTIIQYPNDRGHFQDI